MTEAAPKYEAQPVGKLSLYNINDSILRIMEQCDHETGEVTDEQMERLDALDLAFEAKCENVAFVVRTFQAEADAYANEAKRMADRARVAKNKSERLKNYLQDSMALLNVDKIAGGVLPIRLQKNPPALSVDNATAIPDGFWLPADPTLDKRLLLVGLKAGDEIPGASLKATTYHIRIG